MVGEGVRLFRLDLRRVDDLQYLQRHPRRAAQHVLRHVLRALDARYHQRHPRLLRDLEAPRMERQHRSAVAPRALRVDAHRADVVLQVLRRLQDRLERLAVILAVDGQVARTPRELADDGYLQVARLRDEADVIIPQRPHRRQRVKARPMVAHEQEAAVLRQLLQPLGVHPRPAMAEDEAAYAHARNAADLALSRARRGLHRQPDEPHHQQVQYVYRNKAAEEHQQRLPYIGQPRHRREVKRIHERYRQRDQGKYQDYHVKPPGKVP